MNASIASRSVVFPAWANVTDAAPLILLSSASPLNAAGVDIVVASQSACAAFIALSPAGAAPLCDMTRRYVVAGALYHYRGTASELGMEAAPADVCSV